MENNKQNLITKIVTYSIALIALLSTVSGMNDAKPAAISKAKQKK